MAKKKKGKGRGWHDEPGRHALARRGIESIRLEGPVPVLPKAADQEILKIKRLQAQLRDPNTPIQEASMLRDKIAKKEKAVMRIIRSMPERIKLKEAKK